MYGQLKDFLGFLLDSDGRFESENVNLACGVVLTRVIDYFLFITVMSFTYIHSSPNRSSWDELGLSL